MIQWHLDNWKVFEKHFRVISLGFCFADALYHYWVTHSFPPPRINSAEIAIAILYQRDRIESDFSGKCKPSLHNFKKQWHYLLLKWYSHFKFKLTLRQRTPSPKQVAIWHTQVNSSSHASSSNQPRSLRQGCGFTEQKSARKLESHSAVWGVSELNPPGNIWLSSLDCKVYCTCPPGGEWGKGCSNCMSSFLFIVLQTYRAPLIAALQAHSS